jgi:hypothetical protein
MSTIVDDLSQRLVINASTATAWLEESLLGISVDVNPSLSKLSDR